MDKIVEERINNFPRTRFMGSKQRLLYFIYDVINELDGDLILDAFSGSGCVSYLFKSMDKTVHTNDFLKYCYMISKATVENTNVKLDKKDIETILRNNSDYQNFISENFKELFFTDDENKFLDRTYANIQNLKNPYKKALALSSLAISCIKKRPRGIFTYTGMRYNDGRLDLKKTFEEHMLESIDKFNKTIFDNNKNNELKYKYYSGFEFLKREILNQSELILTEKYESLINLLCFSNIVDNKFIIKGKPILTPITWEFEKNNLNDPYVELRGYLKNERYFSNVIVENKDWDPLINYIPIS